MELDLDSDRRARVSTKGNS